jgi:hypothetical protein
MMKTRFLIILMFAGLALYSCKKDEPKESYQRGGNSLIETSDGNLLIAGYNRASETGYDGFLTKITKEGEPIWSRYYGNQYTDGFYKVINSSDGGYVATGFQDVVTSTKTGIYVVKTNSQGESTWSYVGDGIKTTQGFGLTETPDHGFIACGYIQDDLYTDRDIYLLKLNALGNKVWDKRYGSVDSSAYAGIYDEAYAIVPAADSGYYITGSMNGSASCCGQSFLMKISANGDSLWSKIYSKALGYSIIRLTDGNIIICGGLNTNGQDAYLLKTNATGVKIWEKSFGTNGYDLGTAVVQTLDGGFAFTGFSSLSGSSNLNITLYKVNASGTLTWSKTYGGDDTEEGFGLVEGSDGSFYIAGLSNTGGSFIYLNKTDSEGTELWQKNLK